MGVPPVGLPATRREVLGTHGHLNLEWFPPVVPQLLLGLSTGIAGRRLEHRSMLVAGVRSFLGTTKPYPSAGSLLPARKQSQPDDRAVCTERCVYGSGVDLADQISSLPINRPYRERPLFLGQHMDDEPANQLIRLLTYPDGVDRSRGIYTHANSPGGAVLDGISALDTTQSVGPDAHTICVGLAASVGSFALTGGEMTKRIALPHARVMIHQPASSFYEGQAGEFLLEAGEILKLRDCITGIYVQRTGKPWDVVSGDMERDVFLSAEEAQIYGIIDLVGRIERKEPGGRSNSFR